MNVSGPKNLGFQSSAPASSSGRGAPTKDKSSFENLLGQSRKDDTQSGNKDFSRKDSDSRAPALPVTTVKKRAPETAKEKSPGERDLTAEITARQAERSAANQSERQTDRPDSKPTESSDSANQDPALKAERDASASGANASNVPMPSSGTMPSLSGPAVNDRNFFTQAPSGASAGSAGSALNKPGATAGQDDSANTLTRRVVWNDFLRKMSGLGVSVEDVMGAFSSLSEKELAQPPGKSVESVVQALGLNDQQSLLARQYFNELIQKTQSKTMGEELNSSSKQISLSLMSQRETQRKALAKSLDSMDRNFFLQPTAEQQAKGIQARDLRAGDGDKMEGNQDRDAMIAAASGRSAEDGAAIDPNSTLTKFGLDVPSGALLAKDGSGLDGSSKAGANSVQNSAAGANPNGRELNSLVDQMQPVTSDDATGASGLVRNLSARQSTTAASAALSAGPMGAAAVSGPNAAVAQAAAAPREALAALRDILAGGKGDSGKEDLDGESSQAGLMKPTALGGERLAGALNRTEFQAQLGQAQAPAVAQASPMSVPELVQQAHLMVRDGGGEMKVTMHPEGLGEVALRVSVDNGKVQVQMITESDEAKRLIERSIGELKTGLTQNHLQIDSIKVDTAGNLGKQLEQQYSDAQRQAAQQSMEQFRQDSQGWRRSFFDTPNVRQYPSQNQAPRDNGSASGVSTSSRSGSGSRRLDLVA